MLNARKILFAAAVAVGAISPVALADSGPRYVLQRIPMGPRPDNHVLVRVDRAERPYALTGSGPKGRADRAASRPMPSHPKGTHGQY